MIYSDYWGGDESRSIEMDRQLLSNLNAYNRDVKLLAPKLKGLIETNKSSLLTGSTMFTDNPELVK